MAEPTAQVLNALSSLGLLLIQDKRLPNVVTLLTGESLRTSWWSHPKGRLIYAVLSELSEHADVLVTKLLYGKVTLVHRRLWPAVLAVVSTREAWQLRGLSAPGRSLLTAIDESKAAIRVSGLAGKELERRLLVHAEEVHTESGRHETALESWSAWAQRVEMEPSGSDALGRQRLEEAASAIGAALSAFPWS